MSCQVVMFFVNNTRIILRMPTLERVTMSSSIDVNYKNRRKINRNGDPLLYDLYIKRLSSKISSKIITMDIFIEREFLFFYCVRHSSSLKSDPVV